MHTDIATFRLTAKAVKQIKKLQKEQEKEGQSLRIDVLPGGCAGFKYFMDFEENPEKEDVVVKEGDITLLFRPEGVELLAGAELDYVESLETSGFQFNNPNMTHSCHCGKSVC